MLIHAFASFALFFLKYMDIYLIDKRPAFDAASA